MHSSWLSRVTATADPEELPVLKGTWEELRRLLDDPLAPRRRIARAILADPALSLRVLHRANAVPHRHFSFELATVDEAAQMLGTRTIASMAAEAPVADAVLDADRLAAYRTSSARAVLAALLAEDWAELDRDRFPAQLSLAALLYSVGELFLLAHGDARIRRYLEMVERCHVFPHEAEQVTLGVSLEDLGYRLAQRWGLPEIVRESMRARNARHLRALCVMLAAQIARYAFTGWRHPLERVDLCLVAEVLDLDLAALRDRINRVLGEFNLRCGRYDLRPLPPLPAEPAGEADARRGAPHESCFCLAPRADDYARASAALRDLEPSDRDALVKRLLEGLHRGLGLNRALVAVYEPEESCLVAEHLIGTDFEPRFNRFRLPIAVQGLLRDLLESRGAVWLNDDNRANLEPRLPERIWELTGTANFFAASLPGPEGRRALVYADRRGPGCALDARSYERFRSLVEQARVCLARLPG